MKKALLLILLFIITESTYAQNWCAPGALWHYRSFNPFIPYQDGYIQVKVNSMSTIGGITYYNLKGTFYGQVYTAYTPTTALSLYSATIYEQNHVVYISIPGSGGYDTLVNLNAAIGDQWHSIKFGTLNNAPGPCLKPHVTVVDTGHVTINGMSLKKIEVTQSSAPGTTLTIIDKIGGINLWLHPVYTCDVDGWGLGAFVCYSDNNFPLYKKPGYNLPCDFTTVGKEEFTVEGVELNVFPNPGNELIKIEFNGENDPEHYQVQLIDLLGRQVLELNSGKQINISSLKVGLYTLNIVSEGRVLARRKLMKTEH